MLPCMKISCGYGWFASNWSMCSANCSVGYKYRNVQCMKLSKSGQILDETSNKCNETNKPIAQLKCNHGDCNGEYFWRPNDWSQCSPGCGFGYQERIVDCVNRNHERQKSEHFCDQTMLPIRYQICYTECLAHSCSELRDTFGVREDGEYRLNISNYYVPIYCNNMESDYPEEFITLRSGERKNFAEIYDKK
jgi:hypothetical protein